MKYTLANNEPFQVDGAINEVPKSVNVLDLRTSDLTNDSGFITGYTETDPIFQGSAASSITSNDISNWNATKTAVEENELVTAAALTEHEGRIDNLEESVAYLSDLDSKQDILVSGTNIKTVNNASLLGSGNVSIPSLYWCTCPTAQATNGVKVISGVGIPISNGKPVPGTTIGVVFETDNTNTTYVNNNVSFNIDSTGAIPICYAGITINPPHEMVLGKAGRVIYYTYKPGTEANNPGVWMWTGHDMDKDTKYNFSTLKVPVTSSNGQYALDNNYTWSDIESAISAGRNVVLNYNGNIYQLSDYDGVASEASFAKTGGIIDQVLNVDDAGEVSFNTYTIRTSFYGMCDTAAATAAKISYIDTWQLKTGNIVSIKFTYNVPASATLNISGTNAKAIYHNGAAIKADVINAGDIATFVYDGTYYQLITVSVVTRPRIFFGFGSTTSSAISVSDVDGWELRDGNVINVYFQGNVPASAKLNVNGTGSFNIMLGASQALPVGAINATDTATFLYSNNTYYLLSVDGWYNRKQNTLVSGTSIKTINSTSLLGSGNVAVQPTLVSGTNIKTINSTSLLGSGDIDLQSNLTYSISTSTTISSMSPNVVYCVRSGSGTTWAAITTLSITALNTTGYGVQTNTSGSTIATNNSKVPIYCACFLAGANMSITLPSTVKWKDGLMPSIDSGEFCELVIMNNIATINKATF